MPLSDMFDSWQMHRSRNRRTKVVGNSLSVSWCGLIRRDSRTTESSNILDDLTTHKQFQQEHREDFVSIVFWTELILGVVYTKGNAYVRCVKFGTRPKSSALIEHVTSLRTFLMAYCV